MVSLRQARIDDHWRRAFKRQSEPNLQEIKISNGNLFESFSIKFQNGISAIIGSNGIGKSTLIRTLYNIFHTEESNRDKYEKSFLTDCEIELSGRLGEVDFSHTLSPTISFSEINTCESLCTGFMYDPGFLIPLLQNTFLTMDNVEELLEGYDEIIFSEDLNKITNYISGNQYDEIAVISIEDEPIGGVQPLPFFKVKRGCNQYDTRFMGLGELSIFYFVWLLEYISSQKGSVILLVEEPESFIPPTTQERISNQLARYASKTGAKIIISTHSEHIIKRVPRINISVMRVKETGVVSYIAEDDLEPLRMLGLSAPKKGIIIHEDITSGTIIKTLLQSAEKYVPESFYYHKSGSHSNITNALRIIPKSLEDFRTIGIYDGDVNIEELERIYTDTNYCFLPETLPPEQFLIDFLTSKDSSQLSELFHREEQEIEIALERVTGLDHHDFLIEFGRSLNYETQIVLKLICDAWVKDESNQNLVETFLNKMNSALEG